MNIYPWNSTSSRTRSFKFSPNFHLFVLYEYVCFQDLYSMLRSCETCFWAVILPVFFSLQHGQLLFTSLSNGQRGDRFAQTVGQLHYFGAELVSTIPSVVVAGRLGGFFDGTATRGRFVSERFAGRFEDRFASRFASRRLVVQYLFGDIVVRHHRRLLCRFRVDVGGGCRQ